MKKFRIKDEDGMEYQVEEIEKKEDIPTTDDASIFTDEEIASLKKLLSVADKLVALAETKDEVDPEVKESVNEVLEDEDIDEDEKIEKEEIVDTDEDEEGCEMHDSINSLEKSNVNDSIDTQTEIANAWAKRYGGNK